MVKPVENVTFKVIPWKFLVVLSLGVGWSLFPAAAAFLRFEMISAIIVMLSAIWLLFVALIGTSFVPLKSRTYMIFLLACWVVSIKFNNGEILDWSYIWLIAVFGNSLTRYALVKLSWKSSE